MDFLFEFSRKTGILEGIRKRESWSNETEKRTGKRNQPMAMDFHAAVWNPGGILGKKGSADHGNFRIWLSDPPCGTGYGGAEKRTVGTGIL